MILRLNNLMVIAVVFQLLLVFTPVRAATIEYDIEIAGQELNITGKPVQAMTVDGNIPGPTLRFREGDFARIRVHNKMSVDTSIHWHGLLVPPGMDGVPLVSFPPIKPGTTFTYEFPIRQTGTYWYHSHTGLQEQKGVYGAIVIAPRDGTQKDMNDQVVVLSDWTDESTHEVIRTLKRGSKWYSIEKGSAQSIIGAARVGELGAYFKRELMRMPAMDISDIAYDRFLANGKPEISLPVAPGKRVRLRIINGGAGTNFLLEFAGGPMTIVAADGQNTQQVQIPRLFIAIAETYDVFINIPASGAYEFRATAQDGSGYASVWVGTGKRHPAPDLPKPDLYYTMGSNPGLERIFALTPEAAIGMTDRDVKAGRFDNPGMMGRKSMRHETGPSRMPMDMMDSDSGKGSMPDKRGKSHRVSSRIGKKYGMDFRPLAADVSASKDLAIDGMDPRRPWPPYAELRSTAPTSFPRGKPVREIRLTLDGDMERYVWFINNKPLSESDMIHIKEGEIVRFIMINRTMMHHPMHLHGHFFRVINGQGDYAPLKHTVDVVPMSTTVIEFDANEFGDWFFHCHLLYHLKSGMARVVHYEGFNISPQLSALRPGLYKDAWYSWGQADVLSNMTQGLFMLSNTRNILTAEWEAGWQDVNNTEWEGIFSYDRYINRFFTIFAGADMSGASDELDKTRGLFGVRYLLPLNIESRGWIDTEGGGRLNLGKSFELTPRLTLSGEAQYDTHDKWEGRTRLSYLICKFITVVSQWHSDYGFGGGLRVRF